MLFFYVRHGDPIYNPDSLTPLGERQADALGKRLSLYGIDEIYTSSSVRAKLTAKPTCEMLKKDFTILDWTTERYTAENFMLPNGNGGKSWVFTMEKYIEAFASKPVCDLGENWAQYPDFADTTFKEGIERIKRETYAFLSQLGFTYDEEKGMYKSSKCGNKRVALFAHQGFGLAFLSALSLIPYPTFCTRFDISHSDLTVIEFPECDGYIVPKILTFSNDSHIYREGLPTKYNNEIYF